MTTPNGSNSVVIGRCAKLEVDDTATIDVWEYCIDGSVPRDRYVADWIGRLPKPFLRNRNKHTSDISFVRQYSLPNENCFFRNRLLQLDTRSDAVTRGPERSLFILGR
jgi:hypothetical protein